MNGMAVNYYCRCRVTLTAATAGNIRELRFFKMVCGCKLQSINDLINLAQKVKLSLVFFWLLGSSITLLGSLKILAHLLSQCQKTVWYRYTNLDLIYPPKIGSKHSAALQMHALGETIALPKASQMLFDIDREDLEQFSGPHTELCCSAYKSFFLTNMAPFKGRLTGSPKV